MDIVRVILLLVEIITSFLLVGIILLQKSKSGGLGGAAFGGDVGETLFGSRAGNVLTKMTITLGIVFMVNTLVLAIVDSGAKESSLMSKELADAPPAPPPAAATAPTVPDGMAPTLPATDLGGPSPTAPTPLPQGQLPVETPDSSAPTLPNIDIGDTPSPAETP